MGRYLYVGEGASLCVFDVSDISRPTVPVVAGTSVPLPARPEAVFVFDGHAYVADGAAGLQIVDVTSPSALRLRGSYNTPGFARHVEVLDGFAYVADREGGLQIIDVSNPSQPRLRGAYDTPCEAHDVSVWGGVACVADSTTLQIIDIRNRSAPSLASVYVPPITPGYHTVVHNVCVLNDIAYVNTSAVRWAGTPPITLYICCLYLVDISNPAVPRVLGSYGPLPEGTTGGDIAISGNWLYARMTVLRVLDIRTMALYGYKESGGGGFGVAETLFAKDHIIYQAVSTNWPFNGLCVSEFTGAPASARRWELYR